MELYTRYHRIQDIRHITEVYLIVGISEIAIGSGQLFSSIVLGLMAVNYSKKVANIETERKNVELRKEKVAIITIINDIRFELVNQASSLRYYTVNKDDKSISLGVFTKIAAEYKKAKKQNSKESNEELLNQICFAHTGDHFQTDYKRGDKSDSIIGKDRELYRKCFSLLDTLEVRDDLANIKSHINTIRETLSYENTKYPSHDFLFSIEAHLTSMSIFKSLTQVVDSIKNS